MSRIPPVFFSGSENRSHENLGSADFLLTAINMERIEKAKCGADNAKIISLITEVLLSLIWIEESLIPIKFIIFALLLL